MKKIKWRKKIFKGILAASVITGAVVTVIPINSEAAKPSVTDIANNQHKEAIVELLERGILGGFPDGTFKPNQKVTRGQAASILAKILKLDTKNVNNPGFTDISRNHQYYEAIAALVQAGIISGYEDKTFKPGAPLTRAQMAKILSIGFKFEVKQLTDTRFIDVKTTNWYSYYVQALLNNNITSGTTAITFSPNEFVTRGQLASFVVRSEKAVQKENIVPVHPTKPDFELPKEDIEKPTPEPVGGQIKPSPNELPKEPKLTQDQIEQKYVSKFEQIQTQATSSLNSLLDSAMSEYSKKKENGDKIEISYFLNKYSGAASSLEAQTDVAFNTLLGELENELTANGYSTERLNNISNSYNATKESLRNNLLGQFLVK